MRQRPGGRTRGSVRTAPSLFARFFSMFLLVALTQAAFMFGIFFLIFDGSIDRLQDRRSSEALSRSDAAFAMRARTLLKTTQDYAHWDEAHAAVVEKDYAWIDENIGAYVPDQFDVDGIILTGTDGGVLYSAALDAWTAAKIADSRTPRMAAEGHEGEGFIAVNGDLYIAASALVLPGPPPGGSGAAAGAISFVVRIDDAFAREIAELIGARVTFYGNSGHRLAASHAGTDDGLDEPTRSALAAGETIYRRADGRIATLERMRAADGSVAGFLRIDLDRRFEFAVVDSAMTTLFAGVLTATTLAAAIAFAFGRRLTGPIARLETIMRDYGSARNVERRDFRARDELERLELRFYDMTDQLSKTEAALQERSERLTRSNDALQEAVIDADAARKVAEEKLEENERILRTVVNRERRMIELKLEIERKDAEIRKLRGG